MESYYMSNEEILVELKKVLMEEFEVEENLITLEATFYEDLGLDSLDAIDLIVTLNNFYNIEVEPIESESIKTVQSLIEIVQKHLN